MTRDRDEAEDIVQEALLKAYKSCRTFEASRLACRRVTRIVKAPYLLGYLRSTLRKRILPRHFPS